MSNLTDFFLRRVHGTSAALVCSLAKKGHVYVLYSLCKPPNKGKNMHLWTIKASYIASRAFFLVSRQKISPYGKGSSRRHFNKALAARLIPRRPFPISNSVFQTTRARIDLLSKSLLSLVISMIKFELSKSGVLPQISLCFWRTPIRTGGVQFGEICDVFWETTGCLFSAVITWSLPRWVTSLIEKHIWTSLRFFWQNAALPYIQAIS